jgi:hypothetical protein
MIPKEIYIVYEFMSDSRKLARKEEIHVGSVQSFNFGLDLVAQSRGIFYFYILIGCPDYIPIVKRNVKSVLSYFKIKNIFKNEPDEKPKKEEAEL